MSVLALFLACAPPLPLDFSDCDPSSGDPIDVEAARVIGDTLELDVAHGGGCADHTYTLCWPDQAFLESMPVQVNLGVLHDAHGDACEAWMTSTQSFDLAPLHDAYVEAYGEGPATIEIGVDGVGATYTFE